MASLSVQENRTVSVVDGEQTFIMEVFCTSEGDLPDTGIFVHQIYNERNPLVDVFQRVATVADIETYKNDRTEAMLNRDTLWRSSQVVLNYTDVDVANQAVTVLKDRINALVSDWGVYYDSFKTSTPEVIDFPVSDPAYVDSLKTAYSDAVTVLDAAETAATTAEEEYNTASADLTAAQTSLKEWQDEYGRIAGLYDGTTLIYTGLAPEMATAKTLFDNLLDDGLGPFITYVSGYLGSHPDAGLQAARDTALAVYNECLNSRGLIDDGNTDHQGVATTVSGIVTDKQGDVTAAESNLNTKKASYIEAQAAVQEAYDAVIAAYEAVKAVCPSWSPSPPLPPQP